MASVMFGLILHFQYAYGWTPMKAGLANLPIIVTMIAATPLSEWFAKRFGHRIACLIGAMFLAGSLVGLAWGVDHGYAAIAACMVVMTIGLRTVMTICAVALVDAMPSNRTSIGAALNDTAQEVGTSVGTAVVGTLIAALVTTQLPAGTWSSALVESFFHGERITYAVLAVVVGLIAAGVRSPSPTPTPPRNPPDEARTGTYTSGSGRRSSAGRAVRVGLWRSCSASRKERAWAGRRNTITGGPDAAAAHARISERLLRNDVKCQTTSESRANTVRHDSWLPLQISCRSRIRVAVRRRRRVRLVSRP